MRFCKYISMIFLSVVILFFMSPIYFDLADIARVDFFNQGNKNNQLIVISGDGNFLQPNWFRSSQGNGTVFETDAGYFWQQQNIVFKVVGNGKVTFTLRGPYKLRNGKTQRLLVDYRGLIINDKELLKNTITVSHDEPVSFEYKVKDGDFLRVTIKYRIHNFLAGVDFPSINWFGAFLTLFVLVAANYYFAKLNFEAFIERAKHFICDVNWKENIIRKYNSISPVYRTSFWSVFIVVNLVWAYHSIHFLWGNHDWLYIKNGWWDWYSLYNGRFSSTFLYQLLGGRFLPILNNMFAWFGFVLGAILLAVYWRIPKTKYNFITLALLLTLSPFVIIWFYFLMNTISNLWIPAFIVSALMLSEKSGLKNFIAAVLLLVMALGSYAACINTVAVVFGGKVLMEYYFENKSLKACLKMFWRTIACVGSGLIVFKGIIWYLKEHDLMFNLYNNETISLKLLLPKSWEMFKAGVEQFVMSYPFIDNAYLYAMLLLSGLSLVVLFVGIKERNCRDHIKCLCVSIFMVLAILFVTKLTALIAVHDVVFLPTVDFFGLLFVYGLATAFVMRSKALWAKNFMLLLVILIIPMSVYRDLEAQKVWKLGFEAEREIFLRVVERIESNSKFEPGKVYKLFSIGETPAMRSYYYNNADFKISEKSLLTRPYSPFWASSEVFQFYMPETQIKSAIAISESCHGSCLDEKLEKEALSFTSKVLLNKAKPWPHENSVFIAGDYIVLVWNSKDLDFVRGLLKERKK